MDPTKRFSNRVGDYVKYRPSYPPEILQDLIDHGALTPASVIADIGSGTGLLTQLFLNQGNQVFGIEPNREMRLAGESQLAGYAGFTSIDATAEATTLSDASVELITAGQAFHWFERGRAKQEFRRILRSPGFVALIWNGRSIATTPFLVAYEALLQKYAIDYAAMDHRQITDEIIAEFFSPSPFKIFTHANRQIFDYEGLKGRLLSSSYIPAAGQPQHEAMLGLLTQIFKTHQDGGEVNFDYETKVYLGQLRA